MFVSPLRERERFKQWFLLVTLTPSERTTDGERKERERERTRIQNFNDVEKFLLSF